MKFLKLGLLILFAGLLYYFVSSVGARPKAGAEESVLQTNETTAGKWETISDDRPPVSITVTPIELSPEAEEWKFEVVLDTHSGILDQDLQKIASLADGSGKNFQPLTWEGGVPGGHHRSGALVFKAVQPKPAFVELMFKDIGGISERSFRFNF